MPIVKTITYENLEKKHKENPKILPFPYKKPFPQEIEEYEKEKKAKKREWHEDIPEEEKGPWDMPEKNWWENLDKEEKKRVGIMSVAAAKSGREYLMMMLSRYYSPRDLYYKSIKELDQMLQMHLTESGGLI